MARILHPLLLLVRTGRPRKPEELRDLVIRMAKENAWGKKRIVGELKKLGIHGISASTVGRILLENGFEPAPQRREGTWHEFVRRHFKTLWACDFFTVRVWTLRGPLEYYVLFFMHVASRRVHIAGLTPNPDGRWMAQQARNLCMHFAEQGEQRPGYIIRDRDAKFTAEFCDIVESDGPQFVEIPPRSPNLNPHAERWVQSVRRECLDFFVVIGERHLRHLLSVFLSHYHSFRPHQSLGNGLIVPPHVMPEEVISLRPADVVCRAELGGLLNHYERRAA